MDVQILLATPSGKSSRTVWKAKSSITHIKEEVTHALEQLCRHLSSSSPLVCPYLLLGWSSNIYLRDIDISRLPLYDDLMIRWTSMSDADPNINLFREITFKWVTMPRKLGELQEIASTGCRCTSSQKADYWHQQGLKDILHMHGLDESELEKGKVKGSAMPWLLIVFGIVRWMDTAPREFSDRAE
jgi:hypothetical protein